MTRLSVLVVGFVLAAPAAVGLAPAAEPIGVTIHADQKRPEANPFLYGQFIEHLGRCVYGGIWAEMLEDRKFFFPIAKDYAPYTGLVDSRFPVVGASPWEILGDPEGVRMATDAPFVGRHAPEIAPGAGIRQRDLGVVDRKQYVGYIWLAAAGNEASSVDVTLAWGDDDGARRTRTLSAAPGEYRKHALSFTAGAGTDKATLEIRVTAGGAARVGTLSLMPADNVRGMRADTLAVLKQLDSPMYRWPGGNFVSGYDWRDGLGPRDRRAPRRNPAWTGVEHNDFGIDEFLDFCRELKTEPLIAVNTGFGDAFSAAQEVEYCNAPADTIGGSWRAKNGHPEPYAVRYWCVGNEMFGPWQLGFMQLSHYTQKHNLVAEAMRGVDPTVKLIGVGCLGGRNPRHDPDEKRGWSRAMLEQCGGAMDYISEHFYVGERKDNPVEHAQRMVNEIRQRAEGHRKLQAELKQLGGRVIPIAMDEWNYWYHPYEYGEAGCVYQLRDALGVAAGLHEYLRNTDVIEMAHYAQTVNVLGCVKTTRTEAFLSTTALPLLLYRRQFGATPVVVSGDHGAAALDVAAALTADGRALTVGVVNPNGEEKTIELAVEAVGVADRARLWRIAGPDPGAFNAPGKQAVAIAGPEEAPFDGTLSVPAYSVSLYRVPLK
ncbi:MAG: hypothetical protein JW809_12330 [Pirellulales bacterium]|nr:hypothetical protein [Pirellulales bacterium]